MRPRLAHHLLPMLGVQTDRHLVAHCPGGHIQPRLAPKYLRRPSLQPVHCGVFAVHVIAHLGRRHRRPHPRRRPSHRIASQINHCHFLSPTQNTPSPHRRLHQQPAEHLIRHHPSSRRQPNPAPLARHQLCLLHIVQRSHRSLHQRLAKLRPQCLQVNTFAHPQPQKHRLLKPLLRCQSIPPPAPRTSNLGLRTCPTHPHSPTEAHLPHANIECASSPNPTYGSRRQYFKLCRERWSVPLTAAPF